MVKTSANEILPIKIERIICHLDVYFTIDIDESINKINQANYHNNKVEDVLFFNIKIDSPEAFMILQYCSLLNPDFIPISILSSLYDINYEKTKNLILEQIIEKLTKLSILNLINKNKISGVKIHRLVQEELKNYLENNKNDQDIDKLDKIYLDLIKSLDVLLEEVDEDPKKLKNNEEFYLQGLKLYNNGENCTLFEQFYADKESLALMARFIEKLWLYEYYSKAFTRKSYLDKILLVLKLRRTIFGKDNDHPDISKALGEVGNTYNSLKEYNKAVEYQMEDLDMCKRIYNGGKHKELVRALNNIGCTYDKLKNYSLALEIKLQSLEMCRSLHADDNSDLAMLLNNVGSAYGKLDNHEKALEFKMESLEMYKKLYKDDHPDLALAFNNVGTTYRLLGFFKKALEFQLQALKMRQKLFGNDRHPDIAKSLKSVSLTYQDLKDFEKSEEFSSRSLEICRILDNDVLS
jgi:tetratricopeptide (TPR) repeat protein